MRDIAITIVVILGCINTFKKPHIGVLLWSWLGYMNPHRLSWGFAYWAPFAQVTAACLLMTTLYTKKKQAIPVNSLTAVWIIFIIFMAITTIYAYFPNLAFEYYKRILKIQLIIFLTMIIITDLQKLRQLIWVIVISIGYFSVKGGAFTIATAGSFKVWGPPQSYIEDNNQLAVAVLMIIPLMVYLMKTTNNSFIKNGLLIAIVLSLFNVLGSQSRGAFLAIAAVGLFFWSKSDNKLLTGFTITVLAIALLSFMPDTWYQRMNTIENYEQDNSALGRINAWKYAINGASDNLLGMGLESWERSTFALYAPNPNDVHAAHSIYFSVLADHGWIGLLLFLSIFGLAWLKLANILKITRQREELNEYYLLGKMLQIGFIAYLVGGAFLSLAYFDLPWHYVSFVVLLSEYLKRMKLTM